MTRRILLPAGVAISLLLIWFAVSNYRVARPIAEENLRGLALSLTSAIENIAIGDPSLKTLAEFHPADIAFFAIIDQPGIYRFHSNADLIGTPAESDKFKEVFASTAILGERITLGTGEKAYEFYAPLHLLGETLVLRMTLHTYRADAVVRRAEYGTAVLLALLAAGWVFGVILYRFAVREERHQLEMSRRERLAQLGEMGAMLAHEIRNPLAGIKGYAQVIGKRPREARNSAFAERIVAEALRLENLVHELLAYAGSGSFPMTPVDPGEMIAHAVSLIRHEAEQQSVAVRSECREGLRVSGNPDRLGQVLLNLAKNALQAMSDGGALSVTATASGPYIVITVSDTGHGITAEHMERIFEPFFTTKARGTGLGLALCKKIVDEHGGKISVASEPGKGTSVVINLPVIPAGKYYSGN
ncbi:MAG: ATP-binding protein [Geobacteraceae bacterium]|nr:ATP-binding protein [Geobacteraceae bacterium]